MKKAAIILGIIILTSGILGCSMEQTVPGEAEKQAEVDFAGKIYAESEKIAECYREIYDGAVEKGTLGTLEMKEAIVAQLGECGYAAVDDENEINMVNAEKVDKFCQKAEKKKDAEVRILAVMSNGGFVRYDLKASKGDIEVARSSLKWEDGEPRAAYFTEYSAYTWDYTEKGYLFFEEYHPSGYDGPSGHTAIRVKPLDEECRKWNRECLEPIGYEGNNMFISDWSEEDFQNLNFDDLYERMYLMSYGEQIPFDLDYGRVEYEVAEDSLEAVFQKYFKIDSQMLREKMTYYSEDGTYHYRARCLYDCGTGTEAPSPEVTAYRANEDGTVTLTVEAVWAKKNMDCAFSHEVTVRLTEGKKDVQEEKTDGNKAGRQIQYVSNRVLPTETNVEPIWYCERLSEEEWKEEYGGTQ